MYSGGNAAQDLFPACDLALAGEVLADALATGLSPVVAQCGVAQQLDQRRGQAGGVTRGHEAAGLAVDDAFRDPADRGGHDGQAAGHRFQDGQRQRVFQRGQREDVDG